MPKKKKQPPKYLYHHTSSVHLEIIKEFGYLKTTASNLFPPDQASRRTRYLFDKNGDAYGEEFFDKHSDYKRVVWLTTQEIPIAHDLGLEGLIPGIDKTEVTIVFRYQPRFLPWKEFAKANNIDEYWQHTLEEGRKPNTWYVCQTPIKLSEAVEIRTRFN